MKHRINSLDSQLVDMDSRLGHLYEALETGKLTLDDLAPRIKDLREKKSLLDRTKAEEQEVVSTGRGQQLSRRLILEYIGNLKDILMAGSTGDRRAFIRSFIQTTEMQDSQVNINYTLPLPAEMVSIEPKEVLDFDLSGGPAWIRTRDLSLMSAAVLGHSSPPPLGL